MKSELNNLQMTCPAHSPKGGKYIGEAPETFIGKHVKLGFKVEEPDASTYGVTVEHMWVKVLRVQEGGELRGQVDNAPVYATGYSLGDHVGFLVEEIEDVFVEQ